MSLTHRQTKPVLGKQGDGRAEAVPSDGTEQPVQGGHRLSHRPGLRPSGIRLMGAALGISKERWLGRNKLKKYV